ncbi:RNA ligase family protein [Actinocrispum sp. NPDC049592]|uniref:RNA ligase family protein n=1 Tax=Actinocrispum sp. NPDC049592 TaxID=3154835 RepID=UPI003420D4DC
MRHVPYPKIPVTDPGGAGGPWVATEKIHGAQLVIAYDGRDVLVGKRKAWLRDDEPFFGWQLLRGALELAAKSARASGCAAVRIYGELYGGHYPHPGVTPVPGVTAVQTGIWYSPDIRFALFDMLTHEDPDDPGVYQPYEHVAAIAAEAGLDVVPLLAKGSKSALDGVPVRFTSRIPDVLGLPALPDNLAEGIVLRPDTPLAMGQRPIVKAKIAEFDEQRFDQSRAWDPHVRLPLADLHRIAQALVNPARLAGARSKVGLVFEELLDEVTLDVMVDLSQAYPTAMAALGERDEAALEALIRSTATMLS